jgi:DNA repair protein RadC
MTRPATPAPGATLAATPGATPANAATPAVASTPTPAAISAAAAIAVPAAGRRRGAVRDVAAPGSWSAARTATDLVEALWDGDRRAPAAATAAAELVGRFPALRDLAGAGTAELALVPGVGPVRAARLAAALELGRRAATEWPDRRWLIRSPRDVADRLMPEMGGLEREELRVVLLDARNAVVAAPVVYQGNVSSALVRVGELFRDAVRRHAAGLIVVHNHPSGDPAPSPDDLHLTAETVAAGRLLDIGVLDHVIIGHGTWVSLRDRGVAFDRTRSVI